MTPTTHEIFEKIKKTLTSIEIEELMGGLIINELGTKNVKEIESIIATIRLDAHLFLFRCIDNEKYEDNED